MSQVLTLGGSRASLELFDAIEQSDFGKVWRLVKSGRGLQGEDPESGLTPLALAAEMGQTEVVRILLENEVDPNWGGSVTPLEAAVLEGNPEIVDLLLAAGADVNRPVEEGFTPLMSAVTMGNARISRQLLDAGAKTRLKNADGDTALDLAEAAGFEKLAETLRKHKPKPRPVPAEFLRPLELPKSKHEARSSTPPSSEASEAAIEKDWIQPDVEQVAANLGHVANTNDLPPYEPAPDLAPEPIPVPAAEAPVSRTADPKPPELAGIERFEALLKVEDHDAALSMFAQGLVGVEERDRNGRTALMMAAGDGVEELVEALVATGADVRARDDSESRDTALVLAIRHEGPNRTDIVRRLVEAGGDLETRHGAKGVTPLMEAATADVYGDVGSPVNFAPVTKLLIAKGAELEATDAQGNTVWQVVKRSAMATLTSSPYRRRLHQMLRVLESAGCQQTAGRL
ncbi:MAG: ankyrin repeat domain-containing protein [Thermoanaerobaculia bacterium]|nr:ankyrin repeat domain-containing protein [Thermoanaerobaculia bacterium]